ncbi:MAG TPA: PH domain-containing protein [Anaerolineales bacterium]|nr:PH domain-containing protein [Anaerolineales bacterium]HNA89113.1 PH domain-containing protein [Anaerolineales bacterium]HNB37247.1 PH domain-containing protein [Anaerolineales bacterium]
MNTGFFPPPKQRGLLIHGIILLVLVVLAVFGFFNLSSAELGPAFLVWLLVSLAAFIPTPFFTYRIYSLYRANYQIDRDSLLIQWGLRLEDIPLADIEWIRPAEDLTNPLSLPRLALPGSLLGLRRHPDLGVVEFIAADASKLLLVATAKRVFVISPDHPAGLAQTFARATEMGSLAPAEAKSIYPSFVVSQAWENGTARYLWLAALFLNIGLFIWTSLLIPSTPLIALPPQFAGSPLETLPSSQLLIFPVASLLLAVIGWIAGMYFYRWERERILAFIVWGSGAFTSLLFLLSVLFIVTTPV